MAAPSTLAKILYYMAAGTSALTVLGHTKMGHEVVFPSLKKCGPKDEGAISAKIGWMEVNEAFVIISIFCVKWANLGCNDVYDKALLSFYSAANLYFGYCYAKSGLYTPLVALWGVPTMLGLSQLV